jgi:hypothetical protein
MNKIGTLLSVIFVCAVLYSPLSNGQSLIFAGFTFSGEAGSIQSRYPYLNDLYKQKTPKGMSSLSSQVLNRLGQVANSSLSMAPPDAMMNLKNMDGSLVTVLLVTGETVLNENYGSYNKTFINLSADALIFDYKNKTIV